MAGEIQVRVVSFGPLASVFAREGTVMAVAQGATVADLMTSLREEKVLSADALRSAAVAVNREYATQQQALSDGDEVAILPPVSGGSSMPRVLLTDERIEAERIIAEMKGGADGAVVVFDGIVRDNTKGRPTLHLDYESYRAMALAQMERLRADAIKRFGVRDVAIHHRLGRLVVGETSVLIVVVSAHRGVAFEACRSVIDTLKKTVPIWKREQFADGAVWADGEPFPAEIVSNSE